MRCLRQGLILPQVLVVAALMLGLPQGPASAYQGTLTSSNGGLTALGDWGSGTTIEWFVNLIPNTTDWHYKYVLSVNRKDVSHFIVEVSTGLDYGDIWNAVVNGSSAETDIDTYSADSHGNSDPTIPGLLYGVKIESGNYDTFNTIEFDSSRAPVWGDFYAVDGKNQTPAHSAWNEGFKDWDGATPGFQDWDPTTPPSDGSVENHVLRPDTAISIIPEPGAIIALSVGIISAIGLRRRFRHNRHC